MAVTGLLRSSRLKIIALPTQLRVPAGNSVDLRVPDFLKSFER